MSKKTPSQDSNFEEVWKEMDEIEPLTPPPPSKEEQSAFVTDALRHYDLEDMYASYREAALSDGFLFGDYDGYQAFEDLSKEG